MTERVWTLVLALGLCLSLQACGDDDSGGSGNAGSGSSGSGNVTPEEALMGGCDPGMGGMTMAPVQCEGFDEYLACVEDMCDAQGCIDDPACDQYVACVEAAPDPCMNSCAPSGNCLTCFAQVGVCSFSNCLGTLTCNGMSIGGAGSGGGGGATTPGGACDQLDDCCAAQPEAMRMTCMQSASGARSAGGDATCMQVRSSICP